jgi:hypothetical protein
MAGGALRRLSIAVLVVVAGGLFATTAAAKIVPGKSIAGIELRTIRAEVIERKGEPDRERIVPHEILGEQRIMRYGKTKVGFSGTRPRSEVIAVSTRSPRQRTNTGIGLGSTEFEVESTIKGIRCRTQLGERHCVKGRFRPGERVTDFLISKNTDAVAKATVAIVID